MDGRAITIATPTAARRRTKSPVGAERRHGRGAGSNRSGRFEPTSRHVEDDGWGSVELLPPFKTEVQEETPRKILTRNESPDISFDRSINPYRGCEHGCAYCFARPTHAYMGLSPGLDFETKLFAKPAAAKLLERELARADYEPKVIAIGTNTDPYQPIERSYRIMREVLEVLDRANHPVGIVTKSALVVRDIDILQRMAARGLAKVALSVTTLDRKLARAMEPRAATPARRIETLRMLSAAGIPTTIMVAPVIPALNEPEIERILEAGAAAGVREAGYVLLRLPLEVRDIFKEFLEREYPDRAKHVMSRDPLDARRQGLRRRVGQAHARRRPVCVADRPPLRDRRAPARPEPGEGQAAHRPVRARRSRTTASWSCSLRSRGMSRLVVGQARYDPNGEVRLASGTVPRQHRAAWPLAILPNQDPRRRKARPTATNGGPSGRAQRWSPASTRPGAVRWPGRWWRPPSSSRRGAIPTGINNSKRLTALAA